MFPDTAKAAGSNANAPEVLLAIILELDFGALAPVIEVEVPELPVAVGGRAVRSCQQRQMYLESTVSLVRFIATTALGLGENCICKKYQ
jgi:hypothetical protein